MEKLVILDCKPCTSEKQRQVIMTCIKLKKSSTGKNYKLLINRLLYYLI